MIIKLPINVVNLIAKPLTAKGRARIKKEIEINKRRKERERKRKKEREKRRIKERELLQRKKEQIEEYKNKLLNKAKQKIKEKVSDTKDAIADRVLHPSTDDLVKVALLTLGTSVEYSEVPVKDLKG